MSKLIIGLLKALAHLPFPVLYKLSSFLGFVLGSVAAYRRTVIRENLSRSFPELSEKEVGKLSKDYYQHMADIIIETLKISGLSPEELQKRCRFRNPQVIQRLLDEGKDVMIMLGHTGNWEWAGLATQLQYDVQCLPVYRRLHNVAFDQYYYDLRSKHGALPIADVEASVKIPKTFGQKAVAMLADQTPGAKKGWWTVFLNQETPFFRGSEVLAKRLDYPIVYGQVTRVKRGHYEITLDLMTEHPKNEKRFEITKHFAKLLEQNIRQDKLNWLWSHRRWKHKPKEESIWMTDRKSD